MSHKKLLQMIGMMLIIVSLGCGIPEISPASEAPEATDTADLPEATNTPAPPTNTPEPPTDTPVPPTNTPAAQPTEPPTAEPETTNDETAMDTVEAEASEPLACVGTSGLGLGCLSNSGWQTYTRTGSPLGSDLIAATAHCGDNIVIGNSNGLDLFDGQSWSYIDQGWGPTGPDAIACDATGGIWLAHFKGASYYNGSWTTYPATTDLSTGPDASDLVSDILVAPEGTVWVVTASSVAAFDGSSWTVYQKGNGFEDRYFFNQIEADSQGNLWVVHSGGVFSFDGSSWIDHPNSNLSTIQAMDIDNQDQVWVGTLTRGVFVFSDGSWTQYGLNNGLESFVTRRGGYCQKRANNGENRKKMKIR
jgi:ligand-binding sensor domain-containing protein